MDKATEKKNINPHSQKNYEALRSCTYNFDFLIDINNDALATTPPGVITEKIKQIQNENINNIIVTLDDIFYVVKKYISFLVKIELEMENLLSEIKAASIHISHVNDLLNTPSLDGSVHKLINEDIRKQLNKLDKILDDLIKESINAIKHINSKLKQIDNKIITVEKRITESENKINSLVEIVFNNLDIEERFTFNIEDLIEKIREIDSTIDFNSNSLTISKSEIEKELIKQFNQAKEKTPELTQEYFEQFIKNMIAIKSSVNCKKPIPEKLRFALKNYFSNPKTENHIKNMANKLFKAAEKKPEFNPLKKETTALKKLKYERSALIKEKKDISIERAIHEKRVEHYDQAKELIYNGVHSEKNTPKELNSIISDIVQLISSVPNIDADIAKSLKVEPPVRPNSSRKKDLVTSDHEPDNFNKPKF